MHKHLCMPEAPRLEAAKRIKVAKGHLDAIARMLENPEIYCVDVMKQVKAVMGSLAKANDVILEGHLVNHVAQASKHKEADAMVKELMDVLKYR